MCMAEWPLFTLLGQGYQSEMRSNQNSADRHGTCRCQIKGRTHLCCFAKAPNETAKIARSEYIAEWWYYTAGKSVLVSTQAVASFDCQAQWMALIRSRSVTQICRHADKQYAIAWRKLAFHTGRNSCQGVGNDTEYDTERDVV